MDWKPENAGDPEGEWMPSPDIIGRPLPGQQRMNAIRASLVAAKGRPCDTCECDCPLLATWRELTDNLLDRMLEEQALVTAMEVRRG